MSSLLKWETRQFNFDFPAELYPEMIERIRGTPARLQDRLGSIANDILIRRDGERWSIQENTGHLLDLELLFSDRLDEYEARAGVLQAADMSNRKTYAQDHNSRSLTEIVQHFKESRFAIVKRLEGYDPEMFKRSAEHPRLKVPMRLVDLVFFQAEHDDFHLARVSELIRLFAR